MNRDKLVEYLQFAKDHYSRLSDLMHRQGRADKYEQQHFGKVKFIELLLLKIQVHDFEDETEPEPMEVEQRERVVKADEQNTGRRFA